MTGGERYEFGEFTLEVAERRLSRGGHPVPLAPKAHDLLVVLTRNAGQLVTKRDLLELVWPESFVEEGILAVHISALRKALGSGFIETVSRSGYRFIGAVRSAPRWSIAVLPSRGESPAGLAFADALIDRLGRFPQIMVRPTRAVHHYLGEEHDPAEAGRRLRVDLVVDSHVVTAAGRVGIRLIRCHDGVCLLNGEFEPPAADLAAEAVAAHLGLKSQKQRMASRSPARTEVYEWIGRGRAHLLSAALREVPQAVAAFRTAIELDPAYAPAHAGLALACCAQAWFRAVPPAEAYLEARSAALRALAMDDSSADAQVALGAVLFFGEWNWTGARRSLERALDLNPNHSEAYLLYGQLLEALGELETGLAVKLKALERDPFSHLVHLQIALSYYHHRRFDVTIEWANKTLDLDPQHLLGRELLAGAYLAKGDFDRHLAESLKHAESYGVPSQVLEPLKQAYAEGGRCGSVRYMLQQAALRQKSAPAMQLAILNAEIGEMDEAFRHLDCAIASHDPSLVHLAVAPQWDRLRADSRFAGCLARMGLS
jgi:DNA-binding winged helix-turn-helix (wHTH) protein/tetratricopeptide (TPR) repeat protein